VTLSVIAAHAQATADHHQAVARAYGIPLRRAAPPTGPWRKAIRAAVDDIATHRGVHADHGIAESGEARRRSDSSVGYVRGRGGEEEV
jgi:hypothetical protein